MLLSPLMTECACLQGGGLVVGRWGGVTDNRVEVGGRGMLVPSHGDKTVWLGVGVGVGLGFS